MAVGGDHRNSDHFNAVDNEPSKAYATGDWKRHQVAVPNYALDLCIHRHIY